MCVCMSRLGCFRFNIPERKKNVRKGFYKYLSLQHGPHSHKTARLMTKTTAQEKLKYKCWCSNQTYRFLECGIGIFAKFLHVARSNNYNSWGWGSPLNQMQMFTHLKIKRICMYTHMYVYLATNSVHACEIIIFHTKAKKR